MIWEHGLGCSESAYYFLFFAYLHIAYVRFLFSSCLFGLAFYGFPVLCFLGYFYDIRMDGIDR